MKIVYWSDYACPYCYIGETHLKTAIRELGLERETTVEMKAFRRFVFGYSNGNTDMQLHRAKRSSG